MLRKGGMMRSVSLLAMLHFACPCTISFSPGCVGQCCRNWLLAEIQPGRTARPSSPPHSAVAGIRSIQGAGLGLWAYWMSDEVPAEPVLLTALPSSVCIPSLPFRLPREGAWYQNLTQKAKFWKLLQLVSGTRVRRLTNADDISSFLSLPEKMSCKCKHAHTFEPSMYRYASTDVDSNALYDKIFNWGGERESKFKILLLLQRLLNYRQPLIPCE